MWLMRHIPVRRKPTAFVEAEEHLPQLCTKRGLPLDKAMAVYDSLPAMPQRPTGQGGSPVLSALNALLLPLSIGVRTLTPRCSPPAHGWIGELRAVSVILNLARASLPQRPDPAPGMC